MEVVLKVVLAEQATRHLFLLVKEAMVVAVQSALEEVVAVALTLLEQIRARV